MQVTVSAPKSLQFVAHVGLAEGFAENLDSPGEQVPERERDWRRWWERVLLGEEPDGPLEMAWNWIHAPEFPALRDKPRVSDWCHAHWPAFREEWLREEDSFSTRVDSAIHKAHVNRLVREWERRTGQTVRSCTLEVYFVRGLRDYHREVYLDRLVLGEAYLEPRNESLLRSALRAQISKLT